MTEDKWRCTVCGYVHINGTPPDECPVCGAPAKLFELFEEAPKAPAPTPSACRCLVCDYRHAGSSPPDECPVCGAPGKMFQKEVGEESAPSASHGRAERIVVAGGGIAGVTAAETIRGYLGNAEITLIAREKHPPYYRLNLTRLLADEIKDENLPVHPDGWFSENRIELMDGAEVSAISPAEKQVALDNGTTVPYDKLILATGAHPFMPPILGVHKEGVTTLRTLDHAKYIREKAQTASSIVVIGGGILGLETAGALAGKNASVTVLEGFQWLMPRQLNESAADHLGKHLDSLSISLRTGITVKEILGDEKAAGILLDTGETVPADLIIITAGVRPNSYLARLAGLKVNNGIIVDDTMRSSNPDIFAAGDNAEHRGTLYGLWNHSQYQGKIAGMNASGVTTEFGGIPRSNSIKVLGVDMLSIGTFEPEDGSYTVIEDETSDRYMRFVFQDTHLQGAVLFGDTDIGGAVKNAIEGRTDMSSVLKKCTTAKEVWEFLSV